MAKRKVEDKTIRTEYSFLDSESMSSREIRLAQEERRKRRKVESEKSAASKARRKAVARRRRIVMALLVLIGVFVVLTVGRSVVTLIELESEKAETQHKLAQLERQQGSLEEELLQVNTDEYVEQQARSELKMVKPGEILYLMTGEGASEYLTTDEENTEEAVPAETGKPTND